jgi:hypothetical protein
VDDWLPSLPALVPPAGLVGLAVWWLVTVMRQASADRVGYQVLFGSPGAQHAAQLAARDAEIDQLRALLEEERRRRWKAEDVAARARRGEVTGDG